MTTRKRNEFLDIESEDEAGDDRGYDSEAAEETKGRASNAGGRASKRRRVSEEYGEEEDSHDDGDSDVDVAGSGEDEEDQKPTRKTSKTKTTPDEDDDDNAHDDTHSITSHGASSTTLSKAKSKLLASSTKQKKNKTGVIYLSSLPPYLKPSALKSLLLARGFGPITKVFLTPAVPPSSSSVKKSNRRKTYSDGWVEFASKKTAKICAETLNANIVGGKKGGWYHDDVWNMKYLKGFKWADLMEQVQRERSEREAKRRIEDARARKEEKAFLAGVEKGKVVEGIRKKKEEKKKAKAVENGDTQNGQDLQHVRRVFRQNEVREKAKRDEGVLGEDTKRVLGKIF